MDNSDMSLFPLPIGLSDAVVFICLAIVLFGLGQKVNCATPLSVAQYIKIIVKSQGKNRILTKIIR